MHKALVLLAVLPALYASAPTHVVSVSTTTHVPRIKQDFRGVLLFAGICPALQKRQHLLKDIRRSTVPTSKDSMCQLKPNILKKISLPFMFGKDGDEKRKPLETSESSDDENLTDPAIESDCDWEYRACDTRVI